MGCAHVENRLDRLGISRSQKLGQAREDAIHLQSAQFSQLRLKQV